MSGPAAIGPAAHEQLPRPGLRPPEPRPRPIPAERGQLPRPVSGQSGQRPQPVPGEGGQRSRPLLRTTLGEVLRRARRGQGRTLADVARAARVSMPYLSELERGRKEASSEVLAAVCDALGIELPDLLAEVGRELAGRGRRTPVVRLDAVRGRRGQAAERGPGGFAVRSPGSSPPRGPGDAMCRMAA